MLILLRKSLMVATHSLILSLISLGRHEEHRMPKLSGEPLKVTRIAPKPQPSRAILHGFGTPVPKTLPNAMGANKQADRLKPSTQKGSPAGGKMNPQQVY